MTVTSSKEAPRVAVVGATGNQGGSVIRHLIASDKEYRVRALTRDPAKPAAKALAQSGAEVVQVDLTVENRTQVIEAFRGASVVFAVTNFWEHMSAERETAEGKMMVDAAIEAGVELFIFSGLPSPSTLSNGKYSKVLHFESKARVDVYGQSKSSSSFRYRTVHAPVYYSNFLGNQEPSFVKKGSDGTFYTELPVSTAVVSQKSVPLVDMAGDFGLWVRAIIEVKEVREDPRPVAAISDEMTMYGVADAIGKATNKHLEVRCLDRAAYEATYPPSMPSWILDIMFEVWNFAYEYDYYGGSDCHWVDKYLARKRTSFKDWLERSADLSFYAA